MKKRQSRPRPHAGRGQAGHKLEMVLPKKAWIIVAVNWEHNDEWSFYEGEVPFPQIYYDKAQAEQECARRVEEFCAQQTPEDFEICWPEYFPEGVDDESAVTWDEVRERGFPEPYNVMELTHARPRGKQRRGAS